MSACVCDRCGCGEERANAEKVRDDMQTRIDFLYERLAATGLERDEHRDTLVKCASRERHIDSEHKHTVRDLNGENERLRGMVARLQDRRRDADEEIERLRCDVERLDPEWVRHHTASEISIATQQLRSEVERLRAALTEIATESVYGGTVEFTEDARRIARGALENK